MYSSQFSVDFLIDQDAVVSDVPISLAHPPVTTRSIGSTHVTGSVKVPLTVAEGHLQEYHDVQEYHEFTDIDTSGGIFSVILSLVTSQIFQKLSIYLTYIVFSPSTVLHQYEL